MTVNKALADIMDALKTSHLEHEALKTAMEDRFAAMEDRFAAIEDRFAAVEDRFAAVEDRFAAVDNRLDKLGLEFEAFRHDTKITLDMLSELMARTGRQEAHLAALDRRVTRTENHLRLKPLPNPGDQ